MVAHSYRKPHQCCEVSCCCCNCYRMRYFLCERGVPLLVATTLAAWRHQSRQSSSTHGECDSWHGFGREPPRQTLCHKPCAKRVVTCECVWLGRVGKGPIKACTHSPAPCCVVCQVDCHNIPAIVQPQFHVGYEWLDACCAAQSKKHLWWCEECVQCAPAAARPVAPTPGGVGGAKPAPHVLVIKHLSLKGKVLVKLVVTTTKNTIKQPCVS